MSDRRWLRREDPGDGSATETILSHWVEVDEAPRSQPMKGPTREERMVAIRRNEHGTPTVWCDPCLVPLVEALQAVGTVASCCGHGGPFGNIALADGRELIIMPDFQSARRAEQAIKEAHHAKTV